MDNDFVDAKWAKDAVRELDKAIAEFNKGVAKKEQIKIVWGHSNPESAQHEMNKPIEEQFQHGLLSWGDREIDVRIDPPLEEWRPTFYRLGVMIEHSPPLRMYPREIFNVLKCLDRCCSLAVFRRGDTQKIEVFAVDRDLLAHNLTASILHDALDGLCPGRWIRLLGRGGRRRR